MIKIWFILSCLCQIGFLQVVKEKKEVDALSLLNSKRAKMKNNGKQQSKAKKQRLIPQTLNKQKIKKIVNHVVVNNTIQKESPKMRTNNNQILSSIKMSTISDLPKRDLKKVIKAHLKERGQILYLNNSHHLLKKDKPKLILLDKLLQNILKSEVLTRQYLSQLIPKSKRNKESVSQLMKEIQIFNRSNLKKLKAKHDLNKIVLSTNNDIYLTEIAPVSLKISDTFNFSSNDMSLPTQTTNMHTQIMNSQTQNINIQTQNTKLKTHNSNSQAQSINIPKSKLESYKKTISKDTKQLQFEKERNQYLATLLKFMNNFNKKEIKQYAKLIQQTDNLTSLRKIIKKIVKEIQILNRKHKQMIKNKKEISHKHNHTVKIIHNIQNYNTSNIKSSDNFVNQQNFTISNTNIQKNNTVNKKVDQTSRIQSLKSIASEKIIKQKSIPKKINKYYLVSNNINKNVCFSGNSSLSLNQNPKSNSQKQHDFRTKYLHLLSKKRKNKTKVQKKTQSSEKKGYSFGNLFEFMSPERRKQFRLQKILKNKKNWNKLRGKHKNEGKYSQTLGDFMKHKSNTQINETIKNSKGDLKINLKNAEKYKLRNSKNDIIELYEKGKKESSGSFENQKVETTQILKGLSQSFNKSKGSLKDIQIKKKLQKMREEKMGKKGKKIQKTNKKKIFRKF